MITLIDGQVEASLPADDRGFLYGDGVFETIAFTNGRAPLWDRHWQRLARSAQQLALTVPDAETLLDEARQVAGAGHAVVRISLSRGSGGRAYWPDPTQPVRRVVQARPWPDALAGQQRSGLVVHSAAVTLASDSMLAGMKHANRLEQVMAAIECQQQGSDEALIFDGQGNLAESVAGNLVLEIDGQAFTPDSRAGVNGVGLAWLLDQPEVSLQRARLTGQDVVRAEGLMVINSVAGIRPVRCLDGRTLPISERCRHWQQLWQTLFDAQ
ncbi:MAG: aminodeoxychorismate lyase [Wenzhouxiangella sp.]